VDASKLLLQAIEHLQYCQASLPKQRIVKNVKSTKPKAKISRETRDFIDAAKTCLTVKRLFPCKQICKDLKIEETKEEGLCRSAKFVNDKSECCYMTLVYTKDKKTFDKICCAFDNYFTSPTGESLF
jgi:hypothetical protein